MTTQTWPKYDSEHGAPWHVEEKLGGRLMYVTKRYDGRVCVLDSLGTLLYRYGSVERYMMKVRTLVKSGYLKLLPYTCDDFEGNI